MQFLLCLVGFSYCFWIWWCTDCGLLKCSLECNLSTFGVSVFVSVSLSSWSSSRRQHSTRRWNMSFYSSEGVTVWREREPGCTCTQSFLSEGSSVLWINIRRSNSYTPVTLIPISICKDRYYVKLRIYTGCWLLSPRVQAVGCEGVSTQINYRPI